MRCAPGVAVPDNYADVNNPCTMIVGVQACPPGTSNSDSNSPCAPSKISMSLYIGGCYFHNKSEQD